MIGPRGNTKIDGDENYLAQEKTGGIGKNRRHR
jgi:hypothetical protein